MKNFGQSFLSYNYKYNDKETNIKDYVSYMLARTTTMFRYEGLPDTIPSDILEGMIQTNGCAGVIKHNDKLYAVVGSPTGEPDMYNNYYQYRVINNYLNINKVYTKDDDIIIIDNDNLSIGLLPMLYRYTSQLVESDITMIIATINKRMQTLISAGDNNTVQSAQMYLKKISDGELGIIAENKMFDSLKTSAVSNNSNMKDLYEYHQYIKASMYNELGLNANFNMKREKLTTGEVEMNTDNLYPYVDSMLDCRRKALEKINDTFGTDIKVEFNSSWDYRLRFGEPINTLEGEQSTIPEGDKDEQSETIEEINEHDPDENIKETDEKDEQKEVK